MVLTKVDVARQQLVTAIRLFFAKEDAVSIYSLASNAWEVIDELCRLAAVQSESQETRSHIDRSKDLKRDYINSPYRNFFKHADRDPDAVLSGFTERTPEAVLFLACEDYIRLNRASPVEVQVFQFWFIAMYPEKLSEASSTDLAERIALAFPNIRALPRIEQIDLGKVILERARNDQLITSHPNTEPAA